MILGFSADIFGANISAGEDSPLPRVKPFKYTYEKEIVMYAYFKRLDYFSTECVYAPFAARGAARDFVKQLEVGCCPLSCFILIAAIRIAKSITKPVCWGSQQLEI